MEKLHAGTKDTIVTKTHISRVLHELNHKVRYDTEVKKLLSDKTILAWIMKYTMEEFKNYSIDVIRNCIEGEPVIAEVKLRPGHTPEAITGSDTNNKVIGEGQITYDIRFFVITPDGNRVKLLLNIEAQKKYYPGYDLVTRAVFYCVRMISSQLDTEFTTENYDNIKKVYSIWICMETPKFAQNTITEYSIKQSKLVGDFQGKARYDLLAAIMICLGEKEKSGNELLGILHTLLSEKISVEEKENILSNEYGIETSIEVKEALNTMCNLSDLIEERAIERGLKKGFERGIEQGMKQSIVKLLNKNFNVEEVADMLDADINYVKSVLEKIQ